MKPVALARAAPGPARRLGRVRPGSGGAPSSPVGAPSRRPCSAPSAGRTQRPWRWIGCSAALLLALPASAEAYSRITPSFRPQEARVVAVYSTEGATWKADRGWRVERLAGGGMEVRMSRPRLLDSEGIDHDDAELLWIVVAELGAGGRLRVDAEGKLLSTRGFAAPRYDSALEADEVLRLLSESPGGAPAPSAGPPPEWEDAVGRWVGLTLEPGRARTRRLPDGGELTLEHLGLLEDPAGALHLSSTRSGTHPECDAFRDGVFATALRGGVSERRAQDLADELLCSGSRRVEAVLEAGTFRPSMAVRQDRIELIRPGRPLEILESKVELFFYWGEQGDWGAEDGDATPEEAAAPVRILRSPAEPTDEVPVAASWEPWLTAGDDTPKEPEPRSLSWLWRILGLALLLLPLGGGAWLLRRSTRGRVDSLWDPPPAGPRTLAASEALRQGDFGPASALLARTRAPRWDQRDHLVRRIAEEKGVLGTLASWQQARPESADAALLLGAAQLVAARQAAEGGLGSEAASEQLRAAEKSLQRAADLDPEDPTPWSLLVRAARRKGSMEAEIRRRLDEVVARDPTHWGAWRSYLDSGTTSAPGGTGHLLAVLRKALAGVPAGDPRHALILTAWCLVWGRREPAPGELDAMDECEHAWTLASGGRPPTSLNGALAARERARWLAACGLVGEAAAVDRVACEEIEKRS